MTSRSSLALLGHYVNQQANHGDTVRVFDGDGNLEQVYDLNAAVFGITVDAAEGTLYATRRFPNLEITRYSLPSPCSSPPAGAPPRSLQSCETMSYRAQPHRRPQWPRQVHSKIGCDPSPLQIALAMPWRRDPIDFSTKLIHFSTQGVG